MEHILTKCALHRLIQFASNVVNVKSWNLYHRSVKLERMRCAIRVNIALLSMTSWLNHAKQRIIFRGIKIIAVHQKMEIKYTVGWFLGKTCRYYPPPANIHLYLIIHPRLLYPPICI
jgi:hypothetical protein